MEVPMLIKLILISFLMTYATSNFSVAAGDDFQRLDDDVLDNFPNSTKDQKPVSNVTAHPKDFKPASLPLFPLTGQAAPYGDNLTTPTATTTTEVTSQQTKGRQTTTSGDSPGFSGRPLALMANVSVVTLDNLGLNSTTSRTTTLTTKPRTKASSMHSRTNSGGSTAIPNVTTELLTQNNETSTGMPQANSSHGNNLTTPTASQNTSSNITIIQHTYTGSQSNTTESYISINTTHFNENTSTTVSQTSGASTHRSGNGFITSGSGEDLYEDDDKLWPVAMALSVSIPAVIVFAVTITVLYRRRMNKPRSLIGMYGNEYQQM